MKVRDAVKYSRPLCILLEVGVSFTYFSIITAPAIVSDGFLRFVKFKLLLEPFLVKKQSKTTLGCC